MIAAAPFRVNLTNSAQHPLPTPFAGRRATSLTYESNGSNTLRLPPPRGDSADAGHNQVRAAAESVFRFNQASRTFQSATPKPFNQPHPNLSISHTQTFQLATPKPFNQPHPNLSISHTQTFQSATPKPFNQPHPNLFNQPHPNLSISHTQTFQSATPKPFN